MILKKIPFKIPGSKKLVTSANIVCPGNGNTYIVFPKTVHILEAEEFFRLADELKREYSVIELPEFEAKEQLRPVGVPVESSTELMPTDAKSTVQFVLKDKTPAGMIRNLEKLAGGAGLSETEKNNFSGIITFLKKFITEK